MKVRSAQRMPTGTTTFILRGTGTVKTTLAIKGIPASPVKIDKDAYSSAAFDGTTVSATPTATATPTPTASAPTAASETTTAAPTATLPVVVNAPINPILAPPGGGGGPSRRRETTP